MGQDYQPLQNASKKQKYEHILQELSHRIDPSNHRLSNLSNLVAILKAEFGWWWVGYYFLHQDALVLGPFQGPPACTRIFKEQGVCGACWRADKTIIVKNVNQFPGHIACSSKSQSEIVVPIRRGENFVGVLDVDSEKLADFDEIDQQYLEKIVNVLGSLGSFQDWK